MCTELSMGLHEVLFSFMKSLRLAEQAVLW